MKKTVVLGATPNPARYAYLAVKKLLAHGHEVVPVGIRKGDIEGVPIQNGRPEISAVDTITLYLSPEHQSDYYDYIFSLQPQRLIFNPGTENPELMQLAQKKGVETEVACTLVMLSVGVY